MSVHIIFKKMHIECRIVSLRIRNRIDYVYIEFNLLIAYMYCYYITPVKIENGMKNTYIQEQGTHTQFIYTILLDDLAHTRAHAHT